MEKQDYTYTLVFDVVVAEVGLTAAAVYGVIYRHCKMRDGQCWASIETMARLLGISRSTVERALKTILDGGWIKDETPNVSHRTKTYTITSKLETVHQNAVLQKLSTSKCSTQCVKMTDSVRQNDIQGYNKDTINIQQQASNFNSTGDDVVCSDLSLEDTERIKVEMASDTSLSIDVSSQADVNNALSSIDVNPSMIQSILDGKTNDQVVLLAEYVKRQDGINNRAGLFVSLLKKGFEPQLEFRYKQWPIEYDASGNVTAHTLEQLESNGIEILGGLEYHTDNTKHWKNAVLASTTQRIIDNKKEQR